MTSSVRNWLAAIAFACVWLVSAEAWASVALCLSVRSDVSGASGFESLVRSEVGKHKSHHLVDKGCDSRLNVESFETNGTRYLTVQLDGEVPERTAIKNPGELEPKLAEAVTAVLGSDPMHLASDPTRLSSIERAARSVLVRGMNTYRMELFETMMRTDKNIAFAPGLAVGFARGADQWQIHARLHFAGSPEEVRGTDRVLKIATGMDLGVIYETSRRSPTSAYLGAGAGLVLLRVSGLVDPADRRTEMAVDHLGATLNLRAGIRFLRLFDFDADAFVQGSIPTFATREVDDTLFGDDGIYTPFLQLGVGVGF